MSKWIPVLVRAEDYLEVANLVAEREAARADNVAVNETVGVSGILGVAGSPLDGYPTWSEELLRRLESNGTLTAQRWVKALDVIAASDQQQWFTTSEVAAASGMGINEWRDAPRKFPQHLRANYPEAPLTDEGDPSWPLKAKSFTPVEVSWAMTPETKRLWRKIRGLGS